MHELRPATLRDWADIVVLNNGEVPHVGPITDEQGDWFLGHAEVTVADTGDGTIGALLVTMVDGCGYTSPNYRWFTDRYVTFAYVDRIVVHAAHAGHGLGRRLYDHAVAASRATGKPVLTAEVNVDPPNERSLDFHRRYGFAEVGQQVDPRYATTVAMFALDLRTS